MSRSKKHWSTRGKRTGGRPEGIPVRLRHGPDERYNPTKVLRLRRSLTQKDLSRAAKVSDRLIKCLEGNEPYFGCQVKSLIDIARALGVDPCDYLHELIAYFGEKRI